MQRFIRRRLTNRVRADGRVVGIELNIRWITKHFLAFSVINSLINECFDDNDNDLMANGGEAAATIIPYLRSSDFDEFAANISNCISRLPVVFLTRNTSAHHTFFDNFYFLYAFYGLQICVCIIFHSISLAVCVSLVLFVIFLRILTDNLYVVSKDVSILFRFAASSSTADDEDWLTVPVLCTHILDKCLKSLGYARALDILCAIFPPSLLV